MPTPNPDCSARNEPHDAHTLLPPGGNKPGARCDGTCYRPPAHDGPHCTCGADNPIDCAASCPLSFTPPKNAVAPHPEPSDDDAPPPDEADTIAAKVRRYQELRLEQAQLEVEAKAVKDLANTLEAQLVELFGEEGLQSLNIDGRTVYLHRATFASWKDVPPELRQTLLIEAGAEDLITTTVNANTLSAWVREHLGDEDEPGPGLPELLVDKLELGEKYSVKIVASSSKAKPKSRTKP